MGVDSSALLAILLGEPERRRFNERIEAAPHRLISIARVVAACPALSRVDRSGLNPRSDPCR